MGAYREKRQNPGPQREESVPPPGGEVGRQDSWTGSLTPTLLPPGLSGKPGLQTAQVCSVSCGTKSGVETEAQIGGRDLPKTTQPGFAGMETEAASREGSPQGVCTWERGGGALHPGYPLEAPGEIRPPSSQATPRTNQVKKTSGVGFRHQHF